MKRTKRRRTQNKTYKRESVDEGTKVGLEILAFLKSVLEKTKQNMNGKKQNNNKNT